MENGLKGLLIAAGVVITCLVIGMGFYVTREAKSMSANGSAQINDIAGEFDDSAKVIYDEMKCSGSEVTSAIEKFLNDTTVEIVVATNDGEVVGYNAAGQNLVLDNTLSNVPSGAINAKAANGGTGADDSATAGSELPTWDEKTGYNRETLSSAAGYINPTGKFKGSVQRDKNKVIRRITFVQQ